MTTKNLACLPSVHGKASLLSYIVGFCGFRSYQFVGDPRTLGTMTIWDAHDDDLGRARPFLLITLITSSISRNSSKNCFMTNLFITTCFLLFHHWSLAITLSETFPRSFPQDLSGYSCSQYFLPTLPSCLWCSIGKRGRIGMRAIWNAITTCLVILEVWGGMIHYHYTLRNIYIFSFNLRARPRFKHIFFHIPTFFLYIYIYNYIYFYISNDLYFFGYFSMMNTRLGIFSEGDTTDF